MQRSVSDNLLQNEIEGPVNFNNVSGGNAELIEALKKIGAAREESEAVKAATKALENGSAMLSLHYLKLSSEEVASIASALKQNKTITSINLEDNRISAEATQYLELINKVLVHNRSLVEKLGIFLTKNFSSDEDQNGTDLDYTEASVLKMKSALKFLQHADEGLLETFIGNQIKVDKLKTEASSILKRAKEYTDINFLSITGVTKKSPCHLPDEVTRVITSYLTLDDVKKLDKDKGNDGRLEEQQPVSQETKSALDIASYNIDLNVLRDVEAQVSTYVMGGDSSCAE